MNTDGRQPMIYTPETQQGSFFNDQDREVRSLQWVEALSIRVDKWRGSHLFKFGFDFQDSSYDGTSTSRPVEIRRLDGSLAERIVPGAAASRKSRPPSSRCSLRIAGASARGSRWSSGLRMDAKM